MLVLAGLVATVIGVQPTQNAIAQGGTRSLTILHAHTKEQETITFKKYGSFDSAGLQQLNWLLRDWRQDEAIKMDPMLFDILWEVYRASGSSEPIKVVSAYRSPGTNSMLRRRSRGVAKNSQHMTGKAMDFNLSDVSMAKVRDIGLRLQNGGVGYYPRANTPWVHLDTGGVRHWPKMSRDQLVRIFPDERTVHIPSDGKPLAGFEAARSIIEARGGSVSSGYIEIAEGRATGKSLFQILFGGGEGDDEDVGPARGKKGRTAVAAKQRNQQVASLPPDNTDGGSAIAFFNQNSSNTSVAARPDTVAARATISARPTRPTPLPEPKDAEVPVEAKQPEPKPTEQPKQFAVAALAPKAATAAITDAPAVRPDSNEDAKGRWVNITLPQRRPVNLVPANTILAGPVLVSIPLPPQRPAVLLASATPAVPAEAVAAQKAEPAKPFQTASLVQSSLVQTPAPLTRSVTVPLPVARPTNLPTASAAGLRTDLPTNLPANAIGYAPAQASSAQAVQRIIPAAPIASAAPVDRKGMNSLLSQITTASNPARGARVAPTSVAAVTEVKTVSGKFETQTVQKSENKGFSGSAIRPIGSGFKRED
jgi:uncharacterized protein YcbK (DUF882 family)